MRDATSGYGRQVVLGGLSVVTMRSWLGAQDLGEVPVVAGSWSVEDSADDQVPGRLLFSVPNLPEWRPVSAGHPLARFGQQIEVRAGLKLASGEVELLPLGWFQIESVSVNGEVIDVEAVGLLQRVAQARFTDPFTAPKNASRRAVVTSLLRGILPVAYELPDETFPGGTWERDRIDALHDVVGGWPGRVWVDDTGTAVVSAVWSETLGSPVVDLVDGEGGTLRSLSSDGVDEAGCNAYVVSTVPEGGESPVSGQAFLRSGPMRWGGPYGFRPGFYASPVLRPNVPQLTAVATSMLARNRRRTETVQGVALPDARVQVGDVAGVRSARAGFVAPVRIVRVKHSRSALEFVGAYVGSAV